jgi:hypothetical protein
MTTNSDPTGTRSGVSVQRLKDGTYVWRLTVVAADDGAAALRAAVHLARELDAELARVYLAAETAAPTIHPPPRDLGNPDDAPIPDAAAEEAAGRSTR